MQKVTPPNPKIWYCDNPAYLNNYPWFLCNIMGTFWYLRFCPFSDPLELQHLTFPKPQKLISSCLCLLEYTYKISLWSDEYFLSYRSELNFDVNCSSGHAPWPFELLKKVSTSHYTYQLHIQTIFTWDNAKVLKRAWQTTTTTTTTDAAAHLLCSQWTDGPWLQKIGVKSRQ